MKKTPKRNCANCGKLFIPKDARKLYCSGACKTAYCRKKQKVEQATDITEPVAQAKTQWQTRTITETIRNPKYTEMETVLSQSKMKVLELQREQRRLQELQKEIEYNTDPTDMDKYYRPAFVWGGSASVLGLCGSLLFPSKANADKPENKHFETRFFAVFVLVILAVLVGIAISESQRKAKSKQLPEILKRLDSLPEEIEKAEKLVNGLTAKLEALPKTIEREKEERFEIANPEEMILEAAEESPQTEPVA